MSTSSTGGGPEEVERALRGDAPLVIDLRQPPTRDDLWMYPDSSRRAIDNTGSTPLIDVIVHLPGDERFEIEANDLFIAADGPDRDTTANPGRLSVFRSHLSVDEAYDRLLTYTDLFDMDVATIRQFRETSHRTVEEARAGERFSKSSRVTQIGTFDDVTVHIQISTRTDARTSLQFMFDWTPLPHDTSE